MLLVLWLGGGMVGMCWDIRVAIRSIGMKSRGRRQSDDRGDFKDLWFFLWLFV